MQPKKLCYHNDDLEGRFNCASDDECLEKGSQICDDDPNCFGVTWNEKQPFDEPLKFCRSTSLVDDNDGARTILKGRYWRASLK